MIQCIESLRTTKICSKCKQEKPLSEFYLTRGKPMSRCKDCYRLIYKERAKIAYAKKKSGVKPAIPQPKMYLSGRGALRLRTAIMRQVVADWRLLCLGGEPINESTFDELEDFFKSKCNGIVDEVLSDFIYEKLLAERGGEIANSKDCKNLRGLYVD